MPFMNNDILVSIPLAQLNELLKVADEYPRLKAELIQLRRQVDGLRGLYSDCMFAMGNISDRLKEIDNTKR